MLTVQLGQAEANVEGEKEEENEEENVSVISIVKPRASRRKSFKQDLKGKDVAFSPKKTVQESMPKINGAPPRKRSSLLIL